MYEQKVCVGEDVPVFIPNFFKPDNVSEDQFKATEDLFYQQLVAVFVSLKISIPFYLKGLQCHLICDKYHDVDIVMPVECPFVMYNILFKVFTNHHFVSVSYHRDKGMSDCNQDYSYISCSFRYLERTIDFTLTSQSLQEVLKSTETCCLATGLREISLKNGGLGLGLGLGQILLMDGSGDSIESIKENYHNMKEKRLFILKDRYIRQTIEVCRQYQDGDLSLNLLKKRFCFLLKLIVRHKSWDKDSLELMNKISKCVPQGSLADEYLWGYLKQYQGALVQLMQGDELLTGEAPLVWWGRLKKELCDKGFICSSTASYSFSL